MKHTMVILLCVAVITLLAQEPNLDAAIPDSVNLNLVARSGSLPELSTDISIEGTVLDSLTGEPLSVPVTVTIGGETVAITGDGEFSTVHDDTTDLLVSVAAQGYGTFTQSVQFQKDNRFYYLTIMLSSAKKSSEPIKIDTFTTAGIPWEITGSIVNSRFETAIEDTSAELYFDDRKIEVKEREGRFKVVTKVGGTHLFKLIVKGYQTVNQPITLTETVKRRYFPISTTQEGYAHVRREMVVTAATQPIHQTSGSAKIQLSRKDIQQTAATMTDPLRVLQTLPGVASETDASARPIVRGGDVLEARVFIDGVPLIQPYHFGGARSIFNQSAVENLTIYKSGFPAKYHDAQSAIITVDSREVITDTNVVLGDVNMLQYNAYVGIPLIKEKLGIYFSTQGSYFNAGFKLGWAVMSRTDSEEKEYFKQMMTRFSLPDYQDFGGGLVWKINDQLKLTVNESFNTDRFKFINAYEKVTTTYRYDKVYVYSDSIAGVKQFYHNLTSDPEFNAKLRDTSFTVDVEMESFKESSYGYYYSEREARENYENYTIKPNQPIQFQDPYDYYGEEYYYTSYAQEYDSYSQGDTYFDEDTLAVYKSRYNILHSNLSYIKDSENHLGFKLAWQKRWWDIAFPDALSDYIPESSYDVKINQINVISDWINTSVDNHTFNSGVQLDANFAKYDVYTPRMLHEIITKGNTNFGDFWGPMTGDTGMDFESQATSSPYYNNYDTESNMIDRLLVSYKGKKNYLNGSLFFEDDWKVTDRWRLTSGARLEISSIDTSFSLSPRVTSHFSLNPKNEFTASAGLYTQNNYDVAVIALSEVLQPEKVWHLDLGLETQLLPWLKQKTNLYGKYYFDLASERIEEAEPIDPESIREELEQFVKDNYNGQNLEDLDLMEVYRAYMMDYSSRLYKSRYSNSGKGYAYGIEYFLEYSVKNFWNGWISATVQQSQRQRHPGWNWHEFPSSRPFMLSWVNYYKLPRKYEIGVKYRYMLGMPYTETDFSKGMKIGTYNAKRYAPYSRVDLRISRAIEGDKTKKHFYIELWNVFNKPNAFGLDSETKKMQTGSFNLPVTAIFLGGDWEF